MYLVHLGKLNIVTRGYVVKMFTTVCLLDPCKVKKEKANRHGIILPLWNWPNVFHENKCLLFYLLNFCTVTIK